ncbi:MAG: hypothetical protein F6K65_33450 [Moorea sp. SIO3C2]|nr:hypothetical protein [Moorena sp. SIO3C2]
MGGTPKTALPPQDRNGAFSVGELNSPRVAPLHRYSLKPSNLYLTELITVVMQSI